MPARQIKKGAKLMKQVQKQNKGSKGFGFSELSGAGLALVILVVVLAVGALVINGLQGQISNTTSVAYNVTTQGMTGLNSLIGWVPTIVAVLGGVIVIGLVLRAFMQRKGGGI